MEMAAPVCYRHPNEPTRISCQRCGRPICPQCMVPGSVGFQCPECVQQGMQQTRQHALPYGGERTSNPKTTSMVLVGINAAIWILLLLTGGYDGEPMGYVALTPAIAAYYGEWWQLLTSGFAHVELWHFGFNMLVLYLLGPNVEQIVGRWKFLAIYLISLLGGSASVMLFSNPLGSTLGASGAIYGLLGAVLLLAIKHKGDVRGILTWIGINVAVSFLWANVSWQGHLGGLVGGVVATAVVLYLPRSARKWQWPLLAVLAVAFVAVSLFRGLQLAG
ncbi:rhomboid family intramembrane serine protease [Tessaracoccus sp. MC1865]|uniref:rhomboid family intramembrane serine protease n=1 Tax=Tessaracoccus sp. MC1865 TaxID=2760310 RepID=UPI00160430FB|nr:rhomboid family intramembrane serine protease [Tessaracoccus sp. MC1865]MBB1483126.1 rhomboid family intramembrane serine protease [Tessaracoccus sp. MC1865]QTO37446.1 rhomboid family intramembrane serine protease [Tessaracoccus sp. MC1865]